MVQKVSDENIETTVIFRNQIPGSPKSINDISTI
jgi:hypothetical protein